MAARQRQLPNKRYGISSLSPSATRVERVASACRPHMRLSERWCQPEASKNCHYRWLSSRQMYFVNLRLAFLAGAEPELFEPLNEVRLLCAVPGSHVAQVAVSVLRRVIQIRSLSK